MITLMRISALAWVAISLTLRLPGQAVDTKNDQNISNMNTYLIERDIPDAGQWTPDELKAVSQASCKVVNELGPGIKWVHSYVADDKVFCIYQAQSENIIWEHAEKGGFPINALHVLSSRISPETAQE